MAVDRHSSRSTGIRFDKHLTVLGNDKLVRTIIFYPVWVGVTWYGIIRNIRVVSFLVDVIFSFIITVIALSILDTDIQLTILFIGTIDITDVAATENVAVVVAVLVSTEFSVADLTAVDTYLRLAEDVTVGIERTALTKVIVTAATAKDVTMDMALVQGYFGMTGFVDALQTAFGIILASGHNDATAYGSNLAATEEGVAHVATIHLHMAVVHATVVDIATAEDATTVVETIGAVAVEGLVVELFLIVAATCRDIAARIVGGLCGKVTIADEAVVQRDVGRTKHRTTFTATVGVTLDGRHTVD